MTPAGPPSISAWVPMRHRVFRTLWLAQLTSNIGTWMQNIGAVWLMGDLQTSNAMVALVQTATSLPVFIVGIAAGALADIVDRRRILLFTQLFMLVAAAALALVSYFELTTPASLLALTFALGLGAAVNLPAWQAIQPDLVPKNELRQAVTLGSVSQNIGRAIGPAIGGALIAVQGPDLIFALNALSFLAVIIALRSWHRPADERELPPERLRSALRAGVRYARHSPALRSVLVRGWMFVLPTSALVALLPIVARNELHLGSGGFGALFACFGCGAVLAATVVARFRTVNTERVMTACSLMVATSLATLALSDQTAVVGLTLLLGGAAWTTGFSTINVSTQSVLPSWVRARGMSLYVLVIQGGLAAGSALWGFIANAHLSVSLSIAAVLILVSNVAALRWRLVPREKLDLRATNYWPEPVVHSEMPDDRGPVLITVTYAIQAGTEARFTAAMTKVKRMRHRTGAHRWGLYQDSADPLVFVETFVVSSWQEHLRQHVRTTATDQRLQEATYALLQEGSQPETQHLLWAFETKEAGASSQSQ